MEPGIRRSIQRGFQVTNQGVPAMGLVVGLWIAVLAVVMVFSMLGVLAVGAPVVRDWQQQRDQRVSETDILPDEEPLATTPEPAAQASTPAPAEPAADTATEAAPADQPSTDAAPQASAEAPAAEAPATPDAAAPAKAEAPEAPAKAEAPADVAAAPGNVATPATGATDALSPPDQGELDGLDLGDDNVDYAAADAGAGTDEEQLAQKVALRAWPLLLILALAVGAVMLWLEAGRIGYLVKKVRNLPVKLPEFWYAGKRHFVPMLGSVGLSILGGLALVAVAVLLSMLASAGTAGWWVALLAAVVLTAPLVWILLRMSFWWPAIVGDSLGTIAALKASLRATEGRWWKTFGFWLLIVLIGFLADLPLNGLDLLAQGLAEGPRSGLQLIIGLARLIINVYLAFLATAAAIQFYDDAKTAKPAA